MLTGNDGGGFIIYRVEEHETLCDILRMFDISMPELMEYNDCDLFSLKEGQELIIRTKNDTCRGYILQEDETLKTVASKFKVSIVSLLKANPNFLPNEIRQGMHIALPADR